jgi:hypothetical protein
MTGSAGALARIERAARKFVNVRKVAWLEGGAGEGARIERAARKFVNVRKVAWLEGGAGEGARAPSNRATLNYRCVIALKNRG